MLSFRGRYPRSDVPIAAAPDQSEHRINEKIRAREVLLIDPDGAQLGVKPLPEAQSIARQLDLDLVEVAPDARPPVCRIMDFNRFKYEAAQRAKESKRRTTSTSIKEMKYRPKIGTGDFDTKTRQVARFLGEGHKVKITIMFRGREMSHPDLGKKILDHVAETVGDVAKVESAPKLDGRNMIMVLAPDRRSQQASRSGGKEAAATGSSPPPASTNGSQPDAPAAAGAPPPPAPAPQPGAAATS
ncbi:MAG: translation initiation factor IF-3 [Actinomycetota bacterium]|nr:translation initiation factor IF-3 [Actinomycetota bacterium]